MKSGTFFEKIEKIKMPIRIVILLGTMVLLAGVFVWLAYLPLKEDIKTSSQKIEKLQKQLNQARLKAKDLKKFEAQFAQVDAQFQEALKLLPNTKEIPSLLKTITQLGSDSQLEFRNFRPQKEKAKGFYMEIPVSIEVSGNYHNVAVFFDKIGQMDRIVNILNVAMKPAQTRSTTLVTTCNAVTYRFKGGDDAEQSAKN